MKKKTIAHYIHKRLNEYHDTFIYNQMKHLSQYRSIAIGAFACKEKGIFPFETFFDLNKIKAATFVKNENIVAVHAHHGRDAIKILPFCKKYNIPLIVSIRGRDGSAHENIYDYQMSRYKELKQYASLYLPVCNFLASELKKLQFPSEKIHVLYGGVDLAKFRYHPRSFPKNGSSIKILSVGRFVEKKGFLTLLAAFAEIHAKYRHATLHLVGYGGDWKKIYALINKHRLTNVVKLKGKLKHNDVVRELKTSDIFCLASQTASNGDVEGIPNVLKEAMASGVLVVSTKHGGINELIAHKETGYLVAERSPTELAEAFDYLLKEPQVWDDYRKKARKIIEEKFHLEKQLHAQEQLYSRMLSNTL